MKQKFRINEAKYHRTPFPSHSNEITTTNHHQKSDLNSYQIIKISTKKFLKEK
jgi:hypothetical protein